MGRIRINGEKFVKFEAWKAEERIERKILFYFSRIISDIKLFNFSEMENHEGGYYEECGMP